MKVAVIFPYYAHYREPIVRELSQNKNVDFVFLGGINSSPQFAKMKLLDMSNFNFIQTANKWFLKYFSIQPSLLSEVRKGDFDAVIIFADWKYLSTWTVLFYLKFKNIRSVFWSHGFRKYSFNANDLIKRIYFNLFDAGLVFDNRAKDIFESLNFKNIEVVYNSLDFDNQIKILDSIKSDPKLKNVFKVPYIVFTGRLTVSKNIQLILKSIHYLKKESILINLVLIGDGENRKNLESITEELGISDQVVFYGSCYDEYIIGDIINSACVCVIPSAVGLSAIHALTYGCPVITDNNFIKHGPEVESIVENFSGLFYESNDYKSLAEKIKYFINIENKDREVLSSNCINMIRSKYTAVNQGKIIDKMIFTE